MGPGPRGCESGRGSHAPGCHRRSSASLTRLGSRSHGGRDHGGAQTNPAAIKTYLNRYTPGAALSPAASTQKSAVSASSDSVLSTHSPALPSPEDIDDSRLASPATVSLSPDLETSAIAATQLNYQPVQTKPWASQFVGSGSMEEEDELMVVL
jgi:hypothetical protein